jgi:hypothetical protein
MIILINQTTFKCICKNQLVFSPKIIEALALTGLILYYWAEQGEQSSQSETLVVA